MIFLKGGGSIVHIHHVLEVQMVSYLLFVRVSDSTIILIRLMIHPILLLACI
jgi:hypothetical protein